MSALRDGRELTRAHDELRFPLGDFGHVLFTTRAHGNLSSVGGDDAEHAQVAHAAVRRLIGAERLVRGYQVHGSVVRRVSAELLAAEPLDSSSTPTHEADGQVTTLRGVGVMVLSADCLPVALGCDGAVAMLHAGWRGLAAGVLEEGVRALRELPLPRRRGGAGEIVAVIGPGAGVCCYEVGAEVHAALDRGVQAPDHRDGEPGEARCIDLRAIARERLLAAGVTRVQDLSACTICDERFFSHRREGARAGRQAGIAWLH